MAPSADNVKCYAVLTAIEPAGCSLLNSVVSALLLSLNGAIEIFDSNALFLCDGHIYE